MNIQQIATHARKQKGLTQEELADKAKVTVRTIQRLEAGQGIPRDFTLKAIAHALDIDFEGFKPALRTTTPVTGPVPVTDTGTASYPLLRLLNISCFAYLFLPFFNLILPLWILKKHRATDESTRKLGWRIIYRQIYWTIITHGLLLLTLIYNLFRASQKSSVFIHYLYPFALMYLINAIIIMATHFSLINTQNTVPAPK